MLTQIPLLSVLMFSIIYPLCFWLSFRDPLKNKFHHFHIGLPAVTAGLVVVGMRLIGLPQDLIWMGIAWLVLFLGVTYVYWQKETVNPVWVSVVSALGFILYIKVHNVLLGANVLVIAASVLAGLVLSAAFYAMNLGHWYLNVHGLSMGHLKRAAIALGAALGLRLLWDVVLFFTSHVMFRGEMITVPLFMMRMDGFFLWIAFFFGTLFPFIGMYFVWGTLKVKSTQSATGILYVLLSAILIGDIAYKYYFLYYGLAF